MTERNGQLNLEAGSQEVQRAIGIDPDARGFVCALVGGQTDRPVRRRFSVSPEELGKFIRWVKEEGPSIVALEGIHGQSGPIEKALREAGVVFCSFKPADTEKHRKAVLGENKYNERDAESVARLALSLHEHARGGRPASDDRAEAHAQAWHRDDHRPWDDRGDHRHPSLPRGRP